MANTSPTSSGNPALRFGALFGLGWGVLLIVNYFLVHSVGVPLTTAAALLISLVVYLLAGLFAAARTGKVSTGLVAGLWAGLFSSLLDAVGVIIILLADNALLVKLTNAANHAAQVAASRTGSPATHITNQLFIISTIVSLVLGIIIASLIGLGLGALGGLIGKSSGASRAPAMQAYQESLYSGIPPAPPAGAPGASSPPPPGSGSPS